MLERLKQHLHDVNLQLLMEYGSQAFNLHNENSDNDYLAVVSQADTDAYLGLYDGSVTKSNWVDEETNTTVQFMDMKRFYTLACSSNFTLYVGLQNVLYQNDGLHLPKFAEFSLRRLAHHCLGLVDNKSQRQYMKAYSSLFVMFLMQNGHLPQTLDYKFLLERVPGAPSGVAELLHLKKKGVKYTDVEVFKPYTHEQVNVLPDVRLDYNDLWVNWLKEEMA